MIDRFLLIALCFSSTAVAVNSPNRALFHTLSPQSIPENAAFYQLYPNTEEGTVALRRVWSLLAKNQRIQPNAISKGLLGLINRPAHQETPLLSDEDLRTIELLSQNLQNRRLKGHQAQTEAEVLSLPPEEIDLARGLMLTQESSWERIKSYEAVLDLMALQIRARLPQSPAPEQIVAEMNHFIFHEMQYRFPPHSLYTKDIDEYTFLPSVLDSRRGVCLGVSILYTCLAQRLGLQLELVTPPGHIYVRYRGPDKVINIETTARGIHLESEDYLGVNTTSLQQRDVKETIGLAHFNQAAAHWVARDTQKTLDAYAIAKKYMPDDILLKELEAYCYIIAGKSDKGRKQLQEIQSLPPLHSLSKEPLCDDYLSGQCDAAGIQAVFLHVDENRSSILEKKEALEKTLRKYPKFKSGLFHLAIAHLQLHNYKEAVQALERYHQLDPDNPNVEYFLASLHAERSNYPKAWEHFHLVEAIATKQGHSPRELKRLKTSLMIKSRA